MTSASQSRCGGVASVVISLPWQPPGQKEADSVRVLVASDAIGTLSSLEAGRIIASGWSTAAVDVLAVGEAGAGFVRAFAEQRGASMEASAVGLSTVTLAESGGVAALSIGGEQPVADLPYDTSSRLLGETLGEVLASRRPRRVYLDLVGVSVHDAGAGLLAGLGATADQPLDHGAPALSDVGVVDLSTALASLGKTELIGVVPHRELNQQLVGLRGITSLRGRSAGLDPALLLRIDAALERFAHLASAEHAAQQGAGACGGLGFAVLALGGRLTTGPDVALTSVEGASDLMVTGCTAFDFATRGGGVVVAVADTAATALSPCIVLAGEVLIGAREMRTMGIEAAYAVHEAAGDPTNGAAVNEAELAALARRVARSWTW
jgi:glycerate 2-kinase